MKYKQTKVIMRKLRTTIILLTISFLSIVNFSANNYQTNSYTPVDISGNGIPGFDFPTEQATINNWISMGQNDSIYRHAWNLWTAINMKTNEVYDGDTLRVWETWYSLDELVDMTREGVTRISSDKRTRPALDLPSQILKFDHLTFESPDDTVFESVKYSPASANYTLENRLLLKSTLDSLFNIGIAPDFPSAAMNIKPVFKIITEKSLDENGLFSFKAWTGPTMGDTIPFPQRDWSGCVYVDVENGGSGNGSLDYTCDDPQPENIYNLNDFINFKIDEENAEYLAQEYDFDCEAGDYAILVAMHMTTKEINRWTWETFWWTPDPEIPAFPSGVSMAEMRPEQLIGAASHYAVATAYQMVTPAQPEFGGVSEGGVLYAYNPYLEAPFDSKVLNDNNDTYAEVSTIDGVEINKVGVRTNCMSCHSQANWIGGSEASDRLGYIGNKYVDMNPESSTWQNAIQADFAWSIVDNAISLTEVNEVSISGDEVVIYPNPVSDKLFVEISEFSNLESAEIKIFDLNGRLIFSENIILDNTIKVISVSDFEPGIYLLSIANITHKLIVN